MQYVRTDLASMCHLSVMYHQTVTVIQKMGYQELLNLVAQLPAGYRTVFNMFVIEGYSHKEIAQKLGIEEVTSRSQLLRARMMLQEKIKKMK